MPLCRIIAPPRLLCDVEFTMELPSINGALVRYQCGAMDNEDCPASGACTCVDDGASVGHGQAAACQVDAPAMRQRVRPVD
eukprot:7191928-Prymnesium_polylepis.1